MKNFIEFSANKIKFEPYFKDTKDPSFDYEFDSSKNRRIWNVIVQEKMGIKNSYRGEHFYNENFKIGEIVNINLTNGKNSWYFVDNTTIEIKTLYFDPAPNTTEITNRITLPLIFLPFSNFHPFRRFAKSSLEEMKQIVINHYKLKFNFSKDAMEEIEYDVNDRNHRIFAKLSHVIDFGSNLHEFIVQFKGICFKDAPSVSLISGNTNADYLEAYKILCDHHLFIHEGSDLKPSGLCYMATQFGIEKAREYNKIQTEKKEQKKISITTKRAAIASIVATIVVALIIETVQYFSSSKSNEMTYLELEHFTKLKMQTERMQLPWPIPLAQTNEQQLLGVVIPAIDPD